ncbi:hypothetical protein SprV_0301130300 [Sparganum proliferum]
MYTFFAVYLPHRFWNKLLQGNTDREKTRTSSAYNALKIVITMLKAEIFAPTMPINPLLMAFPLPLESIPCEAQYLDFISQYTTDIRLLKDLPDRVADCLSRPGINAIVSPSIDLELMAELQQLNAPEQLEHARLQIRATPLFATSSAILCDVSRENTLDKRPERIPTLIACKLARFEVDIAPLDETRSSEQDQLGEVGAA